MNSRGFSQKLADIMNPETFERAVANSLESVRQVEGHLTDREIRCLTLLAAMPSAPGVILEIGSFKGRSTIVLAKSAALAGETKIVAVDPLTSPSKTCPDLRGQASGWLDFQANLQRAGVAEAVEFHQIFSQELAAKWEPGRKIRFLWIDGDHTHAGAKRDFDVFRPFLANGAIVALHDVLHSHDGPVRVFAEDILLSPHFGAFGVSGSIAWGQYFESPEASLPYRAEKVRAYRRVAKLVALSVFDEPLTGWRRWQYKLARAAVPHGDMQPADFARQIRPQ